MPEGPKTEYYGAEALRLIETSLEIVRVIPEKWESEYRDPVSGDLWLLDYPHSELQGGGEPRLPKLNSK
jgi:hypothetical protein